jgi:drug/metabolite transporter (DMT)-like permease
MRVRYGCSVSQGRPPGWQTLTLTSVTLLAFAANSLLARLALGHHFADAASFTIVRFASGALMLVLISSVRKKRFVVVPAGSLRASLALLAYGICFSFAYLELETGVGALILFGSVQVTMIVAGLLGGERPSVWQWLGLVTALAGLVVLVSPGLAAPAPIGAGLMAVAGAGWGLYSLAGRGAADPIDATTGNFVRTLPPLLVIALLAGGQRHVSPEGLALAVASGAIASGLGYVIWYTALRGLTATTAAIVQLAVPLLAAAAGVALLQEAFTSRLAIAALAILGGIALAVATRRRT